MSTAIFSASDLLSFTAWEPFRFGDRITISEIEQKEGEWRADVFVAPPGKNAEICLSSNGIKGQSFIVLRSRPIKDERFLHQAVPLDHLKRTVQEIEDDIVELLQLT